MKTDLQDLIDDCTIELNDIEGRLDNLPALDKERLYLTQYALIKSCGTVEFVYRSIVADYFDQSSLVQIHTYIDNTVRSGSMSATYDNMNKLLKKFDSNWANTFKNSVQSHPNAQRLISSSNSLVNNRHLFAHGKPPTATFRDIKNYYFDVLQLVNILDSIVQ